MAARRGKSQARRNGGNSGGLPGWAWLVLGVVITIIVVMVAPKLLKGDGDGFLRPHANPDAQPTPVSVEDDELLPSQELRWGEEDTLQAAREHCQESDRRYHCLPAADIALN